MLYYLDVFILLEFWPTVLLGGIMAGSSVCDARISTVMSSGQYVKAAASSFDLASPTRIGNKEQRKGDEAA